LGQHKLTLYCVNKLLGKIRCSKREELGQHIKHNANHGFQQQMKLSYKMPFMQPQYEEFLLSN